MARKTVLRRLAKKCPLSTDTLMDLTSKDDNLYDLSQIAQPPSRVSQLREALQQQSAPQIAEQKPEPEDEPQTVEFEDAPRDTPPAEEPPSADDLKADAVYMSQDEAIAELQGVLAKATAATAIDDYLAGWTDMVKASFAHDETAAAIAKMGRGFVNTRKLELQKKAQR